MQNWFQELGLTNSVQFLENVKGWAQLHLEYEQADILLFPANFSSGNFTIYEAMASGMEALFMAIELLGNGKRVINGVNGFNLPLEEDLFAEKIVQYIIHPNLLAEHGEKQEDLVGLARMGEATAAFYYSLFKQLQDTD